MMTREFKLRLTLLIAALHLLLAVRIDLRGPVQGGVHLDILGLRAVLADLELVDQHIPGPHLELAKSALDVQGSEQASQPELRRHRSSVYDLARVLTLASFC
jgi:hypothetical protein